MALSDEIERTVAAQLFTRPGEFGGAAFAPTSITHILDQGVISQRSLREIEIRCRQLAQQIPGLSFLQIKSIGTKKNRLLLSFEAAGSLIDVEAPPRV